LKILLVHKFHHITGGAEVFYFETSRILEANGHWVAHFSTIDKRNFPSQFSKYFVSPPDFRSGSILKRAAAIRKIVYSNESKAKFKELLKAFKPDIVHVFGMFTHLSPSILDACSEARIPVVVSCNDYKHICPNYKLFHHGRLCEDCKGKRFYKAIQNKCCQNSLTYSIASCIESTVHQTFDILRKNVDTFLFASEFMARKTEEFWGRDTFRWRKLINPYDSSTYPLSRKYEDYLLFFGRFVEEKGVDVLLRAMELAPSAKLVAVGDGPEYKMLLALKEQLNLSNVEFVGPKWGQDLDRLLANARFVVIPSVWHENFPYVILQSFAMGKAVIGTDRGGIPELVINGKTGYIYPAHDHEALAQHISYLWDNPNEAVAMGERAKVYVDSEFTDDEFYENLIEIYKEACN
jgi:glycosyltransferase involved in cell wall biosynthesis